MKLALFLAAGLLVCAPCVLRADGRDSHFSRTRETFLVEDDLAYARCIDLLRDGTYRQINRGERGSEEVDRGTWDQSAGGVLRLRATRHALRFRALVAGPLSVSLDSQAQSDGLKPLSDAIAAFLHASADAVFAARDVAELGTRGWQGVEPSHLAVARQTETCSRGELEALARQIASFVRTEESGVYVLTPAKMVAGAPVFSLADDTFSAGDLAWVKRAYGVLPGGRPPFYFVPVEASVFAREVGSWRVPRLPGSPE